MVSFVHSRIDRIHKEERKKLVHRVSNETQNLKW